MTDRTRPIDPLDCPVTQFELTANYYGRGAARLMAIPAEWAAEQAYEFARAAARAAFCCALWARLHPRSESCD